MGKAERQYGEERAEAKPGLAERPATRAEDRLQAEPEVAAAPARPADRIDRALPAWMRAFVRTRESGLLLAAAVIGLASGVLDVALNEVAQKTHEILFAIPRGALL
ncbi:MAG TPA: hypothetical protein VEK35_08285, partial [Roseiarcus sp.]|nr:hypothetical protein [Roseiarcus sp.]